MKIWKSQIAKYICNGNDAEINAILAKIIKDMGNKKSTMHKEAKDYYNVIQALKSQAYKRNESTQRQYLCKINGLEDYIRENKLSDNLYDFDYTSVFNYKEYLNNCQLGYSTCHEKFKCIKTLLKEIGNNPNFHYDYNPKIESLEIDKSKEKRSLADKQQKQIVLSDNQIKALETLELTDENERQVRDLFLLQCFTGARFSDIDKLLNPNNLIKNNGKYCVRYMDKKEGNRKNKLNYVHAPLYLEPSALPLWKKLISEYIRIDLNNENLYNYTLKRIAKKSGAFAEEKTFINARGKEVTKHPYELISSHSGRHTFITRHCEEFSPEDLIVFTGHSDTRCIENHYLHRSEKLADGQLERVTNKFLSNQQSTDNNNVDINCMSAVIKKALWEELTNPQIKELEKYKEKVEEFEELFSENEKSDRIAELALSNDIVNVMRDFREEGN